MTSLLPAVDPEQIMAKLRTDGATWFVPDFGRGDSGVDDNADKSNDVDLSDDIDGAQDESAKKERSDDLDETTDFAAEDVDDDADEDESDD